MGGWLLGVPWRSDFSKTCSGSSLGSYLGLNGGDQVALGALLASRSPNQLDLQGGWFGGSVAFLGALIFSQKFAKGQVLGLT